VVLIALRLLTRTIKIELPSPTNKSLKDKSDLSQGKTNGESLSPQVVRQILSVPEKQEDPEEWVTVGKKNRRGKS
jgi:hypothetical protein